MPNYVLTFEYETDDFDYSGVADISDVMRLVRCARTYIDNQFRLPATAAAVRELIEPMGISDVSFGEVDVGHGYASFELTVRFEATSDDVREKAQNIANQVPGGYDYTASCGPSSETAVALRLNMILDTWRLRGDGLRRSGGIRPSNRDLRL